MKAKITVSCIWNVDPRDEEMAQDLIERRPKDILLDYLQDALAGSEDLSNLEASIKPIKE